MIPTSPQRSDHTAMTQVPAPASAMPATRRHPGRLAAACASAAILLAATPTPSLATATCIPVRVGYMDQHRPPYWLGEGTDVPDLSLIHI